MEDARTGKLDPVTLNEMQANLDSKKKQLIFWDFLAPSITTKRENGDYVPPRTAVDLVIIHA
jgi:hypothetical protein